MSFSTVSCCFFLLFSTVLVLKNGGFDRTGLRALELARLLVSFQWKNPDFLIKNYDFRLKNVD